MKDRALKTIVAFFNSILVGVCVVAPLYIGEAAFAQTQNQGLQNEAPQHTEEQLFHAAIRTEVATQLSLELRRYMNEEGAKALETEVLAWRAKYADQKDVINLTEMERQFANTKAYNLLLAHLPKAVTVSAQKVGAEITKSSGNKASATQVGRIAMAYLKRYQSKRIQSKLAYENNRAWAFRALENLAGRRTTEGGAILPFMAEKDPSKNIAPDKLKIEDFYLGDVSLSQDKPEDIKRTMPSRLKKAAHDLGKFTMNFGVQSTLFNLPLGFIMIQQLGIDSTRDPMALEHFIESLKDPAAHAGFAAFIAANHQVSHLLSGVLSGKYGRHLLPYIGMSAGMTVSQQVHALLVDQDLRTCVRSKFKSSEACDNAYNHWVTLGKIDELAPGIFGLCSSALFSAAIQKIGTSVYRGGKIARLRFAGMTIREAKGFVQTAGAAVRAASMFSPHALVVNFVFLAADTALAPYLIPWFTDLQSEKVNFANLAWRAQYSTLMDPIGGMFRVASIDNVYPIQNSINFMRLWVGSSVILPKIDDVKTMQDARKNLNNSLARAEKGNWTAPKDPMACQQPYTVTTPGYKEIENPPLPENANFWDRMKHRATNFVNGGIWKTEHMRKGLPLLANAERMRTCATEGNLAESVTHFAKVNIERRKLLLQKPTEVSEIWGSALMGFSIVKNATQGFYPYVLNALHALWAQANGKTSNYETDLSLEKLTQVVNDNANVKQIAERNEVETEQMKGKYPTNIGEARTPELVDYMIASMVCNPQTEESPSLRQRFKTLRWLPSTKGWKPEGWPRWTERILPEELFGFKDTIPAPRSPTIVQSAGFYPSFVPPGIVEGFTMNPCYGGLRTPEIPVGLGQMPIEAYPYKDAEGNPSLRTASMHVDQWEIDDGNEIKTYEGLLQIALQYARQDLVGPPEFPDSSFDLWWGDRIQPLVTDAYMTYDREYQWMLRDKFYPALSSRRMKAFGTCFAGEDEAESGESTYDASKGVSCGVFHTMELEVRQYLTVLKSIHLGPYKDPKMKATYDKENTRFLAAAKQVVDALRGKTKIDQDDNIFDTEHANGPVENLRALVIDPLAAAPTPSETEQYKLMTANAVFDQIKNILAERKTYAEITTAVDINHETEVDLSQPQPEVKGSNPFTRGGG